MTKHPPISPEEFIKIYSKVPRLTANLIIQSDEGILLSLRTLKSYHGQWHMPGGTLLFQEKVDNAVLRVAQEELGIKVEIQKLLGYIEYPSEVEERGFGYTVGLAFLCKYVSGTIRGSEQATEIKYFKKIPEKTIHEEAEFLRKHNLLQ